MTRISCVPARSSARVARYSRMISFLLLVLMAPVVLRLSRTAFVTLGPRRIGAGCRLNRILGGAVRGLPAGASLPGRLCRNRFGRRISGWLDARTVTCKLLPVADTGTLASGSCDVA